jgi:DhnA family fructose-bisphosphate aldolase class Ia
LEEVTVADNASVAPVAAQNTVEISTASTAASGLGDVYTNYHGNGSPEAGWPTKDKWISFGEMWANNAATMAEACKNPGLTVSGGKPGNSPHEMEVLRQAILEKAAAGSVDPRVVLAVVLEESGGCVRVSAQFIHELAVINRILGSLHFEWGL